MSNPIAAIIGTRRPNHHQHRRARDLARELSRIGVEINTGAADGIDSAAMEGTCEGRLNVFLPWPGYNLSIIPQSARTIVYDKRIHDEWTQSVFQFHPSANRLTRGAFALHARNFPIVRPVRVVIAFPNETGEGGTGQGLRIARYYRIPIIQFNKDGGIIPPLEDLLGRAIGAIGQPLQIPVDSGTQSTL